MQSTKRGRHTAWSTPCGSPQMNSYRYILKAIYLLVRANGVQQLFWLFHLVNYLRCHLSSIIQRKFRQSILYGDWGIEVRYTPIVSIDAYRKTANLAAASYRYLTTEGESFILVARTITKKNHTKIQKLFFVLLVDQKWNIEQ